MKIEKVNEEGNKLKLIVDGVSPAFINTIRRVGMTEVPTMAIEEVQFTKNSSALYDEVLALRLGLVPLTTDLKTYSLPEECKCGGKGCSGCQVKMTLNVKGPATVYSGDFKGDVEIVYGIFIRFAGNEFADIRVVDAQDRHVRSAPCSALGNLTESLVIHA